jgi:hypothetical protein
MRRSGVSPEEVLRRLYLISGANLLDLGHWDDHGFHVVPSANLSDDAAYALSEVHYDPETRAMKVRLADRLAATRELVKILGLDKPAPEEEDSGDIGQRYADVAALLDPGAAGDSGEDSDDAGMGSGESPPDCGPDQSG